MTGKNIRNLKIGFITLWLAGILTCISLMFWHSELKYSLPTPVPQHYREVKTGEFINISAKLNTPGNKPVFVHFFNPDCPCSRFNIPHFKSLVKKYGSEISFSVVVLNKNKNFTVEEVQDKFGLTVPVLFDNSIADLCGVYSTPQAVLLDSEHKLYFRGNYNKSRYCTDNNSNFAQMAIDSLLHQHPNPIFSPLALKAYGCQLPNCTK